MSTAAPFLVHCEVPCGMVGRQDSGFAFRKAKRNVMARAQRGSKTNAREVPTAISIKAVVDLSEEAPVFYVNYAELTHTSHEFSLVGIRMPSKPTEAQIESIAENGELRVSGLFQILLPPTMIPGLIRALTAQRNAYEARFGPIHDRGEDDAG